MTEALKSTNLLKLNCSTLLSEFLRAWRARRVSVGRMKEKGDSSTGKAKTVASFTAAAMRMSDGGSCVRPRPSVRPSVRRLQRDHPFVTSATHQWGMRGGYWNGAIRNGGEREDKKADKGEGAK